MIIDLLHNKIVKETLTEGFTKSVNDNLIPKLYGLYGTSLEGIQMYEDYIKDEFLKDGYWYYPLTVLIAGVNAVIWIKWDVSDASLFDGGIPYAYVGEGDIDFLIADDVPIAFKNAIEGRKNYFEGGLVKLNVTTDAPNITILAGKYSQTFIDEMNRQISRAIAKACGVKGLEESSIELDIVFAPNTYMEHTSENVTYRRLLISAKGCTARDFWIKWTRLESSVAFSVNDNVNESNIVFELGEDVPHKTREKEYRFLVYGNSDKYRVAMGRKNITEWRELIKRAVKRGELVKTTSELEAEVHATEVSDKLSEILEKCGVAVPVTVSSEIRSNADEANEALRLAVLGENAALEEEEKAEEAPELEIEITEALEEATETMEEELEALEEAEAEEITEAVSDDAPEFDFAADSGEFSFGEGDGVELTMEDILEEFIPKSEPEEEESTDVQLAEVLDIDAINESESVHFDIYKNDKDTYIDTDIDKTEETEAPEPKIEIIEEPEEQSVEEPETVEEDANEEPERKVEIKVERTYLGDDLVARLEAEIANARRQLESERMARESVELLLEGEKIARIAKEEELEREKDARFELEEELEREKLARIQAQEELDLERSVKVDTAAKVNDAFISQRTAENQLEIERLTSQELRAQIEKQKFAIEEVKKLVEEETNARKLAEAEADRLRAEFEPLQNENVRLVEAARVAEEACREAESKCRENEEKLLYQMELAEKEREREKNLFAVAARQAQEESERYIAEQREAEELRRKEEDRIDALRRAEEERLSAEERLKAEKERIEAEVALRMAGAEAGRKSIEERALEERLRMEERARLNAEAKASESVDYMKPVAQSNVGEEYEKAPDTVENTASYSEGMEEAPVSEPLTADIMAEPMINYTYTSKLARLMFRRTVDPNITSRLHEMISFALTEFKKDKLYIKIKASIPDTTTVVLNFVKFPEEEKQLLVDIINYLGNSDLGIYKIILE